MQCQCGCGKDAGVYPRTRGSQSRGDPRPYLRGHWNYRRRRDDLLPPNPSGVCLCGCGQKTAIAHQTDLTAGTVVGQHKRYWRHHGGRATWRDEITPDLWKEEDRGFSTPCWIWTGRSLNQYGHGKVTMRGRVLGAHRAMYEQIIGPIPQGLEIDHLCKQPSCIRPEHLEPVTHAENIRRSSLAKLTWVQVHFIRKSVLPPRFLAEQFGITRRTVHDIRSGRSWVAR